MQPGDLAWNHLREGSRLVALLEVRYMNGQPEWVQVLDGSGTRWTAAALIEVINAAG